MEKIKDFFKELRKEVREDIAERRIQYSLINKNFENIEAINTAVLEYIESLDRLKRARDAAAQGLKNKMEKILPINVIISKLPDPLKIIEMTKKLNINKK